METFVIEAYSDTVGPALWCEEWRCPTCDYVMTPETVDYEPHCPLHNPMYCSGRNNGRPHGIMPCNPIPGAEVFIIDFDNWPNRTTVGRIPERRLAVIEVD